MGAEEGGGMTEPHLTPRELDVLRSYCDTHSYKETGRALGIATDTVKARLTSARLKLDAVDSWGACAKAQEAGLLARRAA